LWIDRFGMVLLPFNYAGEIQFMYRVQLSNFEGPLDLLLFFIKRDELNIYDIPISYITDQFLDTIRAMEELDLDVASEFIYMASMLMSIKAKMMLPREESLENLPDEEDPRFELVQRLLEYKRYKEMAEKMGDMQEEAQLKTPRGTTDPDQVKRPESGEALRDVTLFDLIAAYKNVLYGVERRRITHTVETYTITVEQQAEYLLSRLQREGKRSFRDLCNSFKTRIEVVTAFLAALEMIKEQQIQLLLDDDPLDFWLDLKPLDELYGIQSLSPAN